jgi:hypothetical protein
MAQMDFDLEVQVVDVGDKGIFERTLHSLLLT